MYRCQGLGADEIDIGQDYWMTPAIDEPEAVVKNTTPLPWGNLGPNKPQVELPAAVARNLLKAWQVGGGAPVQSGTYTWTPTAPPAESKGPLILLGVGVAAFFFLRKRRRA